MCGQKGGEQTPWTPLPQSAPEVALQLYFLICRLSGVSTLPYANLSWRDQVHHIIMQNRRSQVENCAIELADNFHNCETSDHLLL